MKFKTTNDVVKRINPLTLIELKAALHSGFLLSAPIIDDVAAIKHYLQLANEQLQQRAQLTVANKGNLPLTVEDKAEKSIAYVKALFFAEVAQNMLMQLEAQKAMDKETALEIAAYFSELSQIPLSKILIAAANPNNELHTQLIQICIAVSCWCKVDTSSSFPLRAEQVGWVCDWLNACFFIATEPMSTQIRDIAKSDNLEHYKLQSTQLTRAYIAFFDTKAYQKNRSLPVAAPAFLNSLLLVDKDQLAEIIKSKS